MIETPDLERAVFCRVLRDVRVGNGERGDEGEEGRGEIQWRRGDVHVLRYAVVRDLVVDGSVELI